MEHIRYQVTEGIGLITLARGKANAMNLAMVREMSAAFERAEAEGRAIVWSSGTPRFFSAGFDVNEVFAYDRVALGDFLEVFSRLQQRVLHCPKPTVAALAGQTYAGGAILALSCDFRVMADGPYGFALTEVNIGVNLPESIFNLLAASAGFPLAKRMFLTGEPVTAREALAAGLVHALVREDQVHTQAIELATKLAAKPAVTYTQIKRTILASCGLAPTTDPVADVDAWFTPEAQAFKQKLSEQLAKR